MKRNAVAWIALVVSGAALVSSRGVTRPLPAAPQVSPESQKTARALSEAFGAVADFVKPSVVQISVERKPGAPNLNRGNRRFPFPGPNGPQGIDPKDLEEMLRRFFGPGVRPEKEQFGRRQEGVGSGFVYDDRGHIVTNNHVVESAGKINVTFSDGVEATATVVGTDPQTDVAVIKVENTNYRPLPKGVSSRLKVGELVMAVGSPFSLSQSVTTGIISATDRNDLGINDVPNAYESFLQTDAPINPGNSGGPLVNMDGQVIGVNSAIVTGGRGNDGVGFAIPIDLASTVAENLIKHGKVRRSRVGISLDPLTPVIAKQLGLDPKTKGVVVGEVLQGSPADKAGLRTGDVITGFNGQPVVNLPTFRLTVASSESGKEFGLAYWRDGKELTTTIVPAPADQVVFEQEKAQQERAREPEKVAEAPTAKLGDFGLDVQPLTPELAAQFGHKKDAKGLLISNVKDDSPAADAGLEPGLLITKVVKDQRPQAVTSVKDFQSLAGKADEIALYVESPKGQGHFVTLSKAKK
jgi:serine protease Do